MSTNYRESILEKFNNESILGKPSSNDDKRRTKNISKTASGPYNVSQLSYPLDLSVKADLQHYMVFYINIREKTRFKEQSVVDIDVSTRGQNVPSGETKIRTGVAQGALAAGIAVAGIADKSGISQSIGSVVNKFLGNRGNAVSRSVIAGRVGQVLAGVGGAVAGGVAIRSVIGLSEELGVDEPSRLSDAIMLPIDSIPKVSYKMNYDEYDAGIIAGLLGGSSAIQSDLPGRAGEGISRAALALADLGKIAGLGSAKDNILSASAVQTNAFREVFFKSINFRTFSFNYTFLPASEEEVYNVKRIIDLFKFHMHPELSSDGLFYIYPSQFEIAYYYSGGENPFLNKISTCVLTDMNVDYGSQFFTSFNNGAPTEIRLTLTFKELELLTKERIVKGY
jgi:hypothetical protein